ncbi:component of RuvABC resolvasome, endonuclease [uncultured Desulfobacterium sp.]|uniref:Crossover junction endodeoxyribonuclease RuvC n=1 Tax=uncultured Desulfobacterium sp. TaxID=201089 RepID=A0A445MRD1_9BACT|nr:component of RuvABC resolvasome, endonuclease [uncultured Desulfobacterium sp.]
MLVLGVDPGSRVTGYGVIEKKNQYVSYIGSGYIRSSERIPFYDRVYNIFKSMKKIMDEYGPHEMAIEDIFYAKNVQSSLKLGHARAAVLIAAAERGLKIFEYTPLEVKKSIVGYGRAGKEQVRSMVNVILRLKQNLNLDTSDALAVAICHLNWTRYSPPAEISRCSNKFSHYKKLCK